MMILEDMNRSLYSSGLFVDLSLPKEPSKRMLQAMYIFSILYRRCSNVGFGICCGFNMRPTNQSAILDTWYLYSSIHFFPFPSFPYILSSAISHHYSISTIMIVFSLFVCHCLTLCLTLWIRLFLNSSSISLLFQSITLWIGIEKNKTIHPLGFRHSLYRVCPWPILIVFWIYCCPLCLLSFKQRLHYQFQHLFHHRQTIWDGYILLISSYVIVWPSWSLRRAILNKYFCSVPSIDL